MKRILRKDDKIYTVTFDEDGVIDTTECDGRLLSTKNRVVQQILNNADSISAGRIPRGFTSV